MSARRALGLFVLFVSPSLAAACSSASSEGDAPVPQPSPAGNVAPPPELGSPEGRVLTVVGSAADGLSSPTDLAFAPDRPDQLWVVNQASNGVVIYDRPGAPDRTVEARVDRYAEHFMMKPSALAFGAGNTFATCQESRDEWNEGPQAPDDFMGPTLWSADLEIFAKVGQVFPLVPGQKEGSHLDMLHESPLCMGIAHQRDNVYWAFDGHNKNLVRYDFGRDHGPGGGNHSDGRVQRHRDVVLTRVPGVASHVAFDGASDRLYVADTGTGRVLRVDTASGTNVGALKDFHEMLDEYTGVAGTTVDVFAKGLGAPSGVLVHEGTIFVSDHATGAIVAYRSSDGAEIGRAETGRKGIMGLARGSDGKIYFADHDASEIVRVDAR